MAVVRKALMNRTLFDFGDVSIRNILAGKIGGKFWGKHRTFPELKKSFSKQYRKIKF